LGERVECRFDQNSWVVGAEAFGQYILDSESFANGTNGLSRDDTGTWTRRHQKDVCSTKPAGHLVRYRPVDDWNLNHGSHRRFLSLCNARRNLIGLSVPVARLAFTIADDNEGCKAESTAPFNNGRTPLDFEDAINARVTLGSFYVCVCHAFVRSQLKHESSFTSSIGKGCYSPMVLVRSSIEAYMLDPRLDRSLGKNLAEGRGGGTISAVTHLAP
jgi:hypothetical protein